MLRCTPLVKDNASLVRDNQALNRPPPLFSLVHGTPYAQIFDTYLTVTHCWIEILKKNSF